MASENGITDKQRAFVEAYLQCGFNGTEAAHRAGYKGSRATLGSVGYENLKKPEIAALISERMSELAMGADEVLARLAVMARGDVSLFIATDGTVDLTTNQARENSYLLKKVRVRRGVMKGKGSWTETEIELHDPQTALVQIGRHHALFTDKHEVDPGEKFAKLLEALRDARASDGQRDTDALRRAWVRPTAPNAVPQ